MTDAELFAAYEATAYEVADSPGGPFALRAGRFSPECERLCARFGVTDWAFVTACNPRSVPLSDAENAERMAGLNRELADRITFAGRGVGDSADWPPEPSLFILDIARHEAVAPGRRHGQKAIVVRGGDGRAEVVACDG